MTPNLLPPNALDAAPVAATRIDAGGVLLLLLAILALVVAMTPGAGYRITRLVISLACLAGLMVLASGMGIFVGGSA